MKTELIFLDDRPNINLDYIIPNLVLGSVIHYGGVVYKVFGMSTLISNDLKCIQEVILEKIS